MKWIAGIVCALALSAGNSALAAGLVAPLFSQAGNGAACNPSCWTSSKGEDGQNANFRTFDDFTVPQMSRIKEVTWQGFFYDYLSDTGNPVGLPNVSWLILFSEDRPLLGYYGFGAQSDQVRAKFLDVGTFNGKSVDVYSFSFFIPITGGAPFQGNRHYWLSIQAVELDGDPIFSWSAAASNTDGYSVQQQGFGAIYGVADDRAFSLFPLGVPEPGAWAIMLVGFGGVGAAMRSRRGWRRQFQGASVRRKVG